MRRILKAPFPSLASSRRVAATHTRARRTGQDEPWRPQATQGGRSAPPHSDATRATREFLFDERTREEWDENERRASEQRLFQEVFDCTSQHFEALDAAMPFDKPIVFEDAKRSWFLCVAGMAAEMQLDNIFRGRRAKWEQLHRPPPTAHALHEAHPDRIVAENRPLHGHDAHHDSARSVNSTWKDFWRWLTAHRDEKAGCDKAAKAAAASRSR